ncbi:Procathepsin L (Fragments) [Geodia barretti]|uniref:Procathepsin L (Fragments) n=1 Tax=Geodia barretti TaxID=519541 RepID=A0AA35X5V9_GEOBA|nr:Procathepsin L (Fragments) [Geodia barretti]
MSGVVKISQGDEKQLMEAVATVGPVAAAVDATANAFRFYSSGILDVSHWSESNAVHGVLITGYGIFNDQKYWLVRNSWGEYWGNKGYIMMSRDKYNQCGIASSASYPTL